MTGAHAEGGAVRERAAAPATRQGFRRFVILAAPRTGSTLLAERCASHPSVRCYGELLAPHGVDWLNAAGPRSGWIMRYRDHDRLRFLDTFVWHRQPADIRAVGFKLLYQQFLPHRGTLAPYLRGHEGLHVIRLRRRNLLANFASARVAALTGRYTLRDAHARPELPKVVLSPDECEDWFRRHRLTERMLATLFRGHPMIDIAYEDLDRDAAAFDARICGFLGVAARPLGQSTVKLDPLPLTERIANFDALARHFAGTEWEDFFSDEAARG